jgi:hypothetical protein
MWMRVNLHQFRKNSRGARSICSLATLKNPKPQVEWENRMGEAAAFIWENTIYDGNPDPET